MVAINDVTDGLQSAIATIGGLIASSQWRDVPETPGALIFPPTIVQDTFDGSYTLTFRVLVIVNISQGLGLASRALNSYLDTAGSSSVTAAIGADRTLGGAVDDVEITTMRWNGERSGFIAIGAVEYWGAYLENIQVYVSD